MAQGQTSHLAGVMGWPVMHSRSPLMHNHWFEQQGLRGSYVPLAIAPGGLEPALRALAPLGFSGCNLTIPHKQDAMAIVDEVDAVARAIGAISCVVVRPDGTLFGTNNDWLGFMANLRSAYPDWQPEAGPVTVIGAGGGARAVCYGLAQAGVSEIRLVNRTRARAEAVAAQLSAPITVIDWQDRAQALAGVSLVVNTTSQGMVGMAPLDLALDHLPPSAIVADIIYTQLQSPLLEQAAARGHQTLNGLGMLLYQGVPAWKLWFGVEPQVTETLRELMVQSLVGS